MGTVSGVTESFKYATPPAVSWSDHAIQKIGNLFSWTVDGIDAMGKACFAPLQESRVTPCQIPKYDYNVKFSFDEPEENIRKIDYFRSELNNMINLYKPNNSLRYLGTAMLLVSVAISVYILFYYLNGFKQEVPEGSSIIEQNGTWYYYEHNSDTQHCSPLKPLYVQPPFYRHHKTLYAHYAHFGTLFLGGVLTDFSTRNSDPKLVEKGEFVSSALNDAKELLANPKFKEFVEKKNNQKTYTIAQILQYSAEFKNLV